MENYQRDCHKTLMKNNKIMDFFFDKIKSLKNNYAKRLLSNLINMFFILVAHVPMGFWSISQMRTAKTQTSLRNHTVSSEPSLLAHTK